MTSTARSDTPQPEVVLRHSATTETWTLLLGEAGPAGSHSLRLPDGVLLTTDRLLGDHPLMLRFSCDTHGHWPSGIVELAGLLFGQPTADALTQEQVGRVPYAPAAGPGRAALLRLAELAEGLHQQPYLSSAEALNAALQVGALAHSHSEIGVIVRAATRYAAVVAHVLRLLPAGLTSGNAAATDCRTALQLAVQQQLGGDVRLAAVPEVESELPEPSGETAHERVLVGDRGDAISSHDVQLLPLDGMRLPLNIAVGDDRPEIFLEPITGKRSVRWRVIARLRAQGLPPPWVRVSDDEGTPLLHVQAQVTDDQVEAPLPDLSDLHPGTARIELLGDPGEEALSYSASCRLAAIRQARRAMNTDPGQLTSAARAERWVESARSWSALGDHAKALIAYDLAAATTPDDRLRERCELAAGTLRKSARALELTTYNVHSLRRQQRESGTGPLPAPLDGLAELQGLVDDWVCEELANQPTERRQLDADLSGRIGYWKTLGKIGSPTNPRVAQQYLRAGLLLADEAVRSDLRPHARRICVELAERGTGSAGDPNSERFLGRLAEELNLVDSGG